MAKRARRANGDTDKNGKSRRRRNGTGTLEKRGTKWIARYFVAVDGIRKHQGRTITPDMVREARERRGLPSVAIVEPIGIEDARLVLADLSEDGGKFTREMVLARAQRELLGLKEEREEREREREEQARQCLVAQAEARAVPILGAFDLYLASKKRPDSGETTLRGYRAQYAAFSEWCAKNHPDRPKLKDVSPAMAEEFIDHIERTKSRNTRNKYLVFLRGFWRVMRWNEDAQLSVDPWDGIRGIVQAPDEVKHKELTAEELSRVGAALAAPENAALLSFTFTPEDGRRKPYTADLRREMALLFLVGIYTGLRLGDCACLEWGDVDLVRGIVNTMPSKTRRKYQRRVIIPIHPILRKFLSQTPPEERTGRVLPNVAKLYERNAATALTHRVQGVFKAAGLDTGAKPARLYMKRGFYRIEYAERNPDGTHIVEKTPFTDLDEARAYFAQKIGTDRRARAEIGFHSLRHTFASIMLNAGAPFAMVEKMLGHSSDSMTSHYYHENAQALTNAVLMLPNLPAFLPEGLAGDGQGAQMGIAHETVENAIPGPSAPDAPKDTSDTPESRLAAFLAAWDALADEDERKAALSAINSPHTRP